MPELIAHRGVHDVFTENTLDAFQRAIDLGFDAVELDVHATADGVCVVQHDDVVIAPQVALSIRGSYYDTLHEAAPLVPRLADVLDLLAGRTRVYAEVKGHGIEACVAETVRASRADVAVHAFDHQTVLRLMELLPGVPGGILQTSRLVDSAHALRAARARDLWQWHEYADAALVQQVSAAGGRVIVWTANTPADWRVFEDLGVAGICTDLARTMPRSSSSPVRSLSLDANI